MSAIAPGLVLLAYLCGSISSAILVCRLAGLPDPRDSGSGNPGATNVLRIGGKGAAVAVLIFDVLKGMLPVWGAWALGLTPFWLGLVAIAACVGHIWPVFFHFRGGKGVATAFGAIAPIGLDLTGKIPSARSLGQLYDTDPQRAHNLTAACGLVMASELRACGVDFTFAPCLDLDYGQSAVIGNRAFHRNPRVVSILATAMVSGMAQAGMACCGKHFPGHGYATADSHVELPVDDRPLTDIRTNDEVPYASMGTLLTSVMPAHVTYPQVSPAPAGFSKKWLQEELRGRLGYNGLIFSDDLSMKGASEVGEITARSDAALAAGCDMILICNDPESAKTVLENQRWIRTKAFDERVARIQPRGKFPSWDGLKLRP